MNVLLFDPTELHDGRTLRVDGSKAEHLCRVLKVEPGSRLRVGELNGRLGWAEVSEISAEATSSSPRSVLLRLGELNEPEPPRQPVTIIAALPRPQSFKKVLQTAATLGVAKLLFINSDRVEQSYFSSPVLTASEVREQLLLGLEQARATRLPEVRILRSFAPGRRRVEPPDAEAFDAACEDADLLLVADPGAASSLAAAWSDGGGTPVSNILLAVGPEGGWRERELAAFGERGFSSFALGARIMRVETASAFILAQLSLLRELAARGTSDVAA